MKRTISLRSRTSFAGVLLWSALLVGAPSGIALAAPAEPTAPHQGPIKGLEAQEQKALGSEEKALSSEEAAIAFRNKVEIERLTRLTQQNEELLAALHASATQMIKKLGGQ